MWKFLASILREFSYALVGERIMKIVPHLPKLLSNIKGIVFFIGAPYSFYTACSQNIPLTVYFICTTKPKPVSG